MTEVFEKQENIPYAQIDENGICFSVSSLSGVVESPQLIRLKAYDESLLGKRYVDGQWQEVEQPPTSEPQPTQLDRIEEQLAARNDALRQEGADALTLELLERGIL